MTEYKSNCQWAAINARWVKENVPDTEQRRTKVPGPWRICSVCNEWADETVVNNQTKGFTCFDCIRN